MVDVEARAANRIASLKRGLWFLGGAAILAGLAAMAVYANRFPGPLTSDHARWGQFGDYLGGVLNPVLAFLALIAILVTIALQAQELALSTQQLKNSANALVSQSESMRQQIFEGTFFQLLRLHHELVKGIDLRNPYSGETGRVGRVCFVEFYADLAHLYETTRGSAPEQTLKESMEKAYGEFYESSQTDIGHYFRNLYHIVRFVHDSEIVEKSKYTNLIRSQLSSLELALLFYNSLSSLGAEKFKPLIEQYSLLKNLNVNLLLDPQHRAFYERRAYGTLPD
ncbi:MAG: hypothetical protein DHS20C21_01250 [Gemmatimonadota bacterium]|nr:MAG: hypothetical protein DHS20C21_01250 [Gemmatimonadota bacterium]